MFRNTVGSIIVIVELVYFLKLSTRHDNFPDSCLFLSDSSYECKLLESGKFFLSMLEIMHKNVNLGDHFLTEPKRAGYDPKAGIFRPVDDASPHYTAQVDHCPINLRLSH